jgi:hypothetical protein
MAGGSCGLGHSVIEVVETDCVDDVENVSIIKTLFAQFLTSSPPAEE